jgi:hypothetical protein
MFAFVYKKLKAAGYFRADVVSSPCQICKCAETITLGDGVSQFLQSSYVPGRLAAKLVKEFQFQF